MAKTLSKKETEEVQVHVAEVVRHGEKIVLPENLTIVDAITVLQDRAEYEESKVNLLFDFDTFVWDGAYALSKALERKFGWAQAKASFWSNPTLVGIELEDGKTIQIPWGNFSVPGIEGGSFATDSTEKEGRLIFQLRISVKRKYEAQMTELRDLVYKILQEESIYKGKAISIAFSDKDGDAIEMPAPKFLDLSRAKVEELIFSDDVHDAIETNLFTPIDKHHLAKKMGVPFKRGVLLVGDFGVGKTLSAYVAAAKAVDQKITFVYCQNPAEFSRVMRFAAQYAPSVVFCEDIDRIAGRERNNETNDIINTLDGVDTKSKDIITVLTTNAVENVSQPLLRPGRLDAVIHVRRPDAKAVQRLVRLYTKGMLAADADLTEVGELLKDNIPAVIREVCERSKLAALRISNDSQTIPVKALVESARTMRMQLDLLNKQNDTEQTGVKLVTAFGEALGRHVAAGVNSAIHLLDASGTARFLPDPHKSNGIPKTTTVNG